MKSKNILKLMVAGVAILFLFSCIPVQAQQPHASYVVYGTITVGNTARNGATVTVRNTRTGEEISTTSKTDDFGNVGYYSVNLGNLPEGWNRNDTIRVTASHGGESRAITFSMPAEGTTTRKDVSVPTPTTTTPDTRTGIPSVITGDMLVPMLLLAVAVIGGALLLLFGSGSSAPVPPPATKRKKKK